MTERHSLSFAPCSVSALSLREGHADGKRQTFGSAFSSAKSSARISRKVLLKKVLLAGQAAA